MKKKEIVRVDSNISDEEPDPDLYTSFSFFTMDGPANMDEDKIILIIYDLIKNRRILNKEIVDHDGNTAYITVPSKFFPHNGTYIFEVVWDRFSTGVLDGRRQWLKDI